MHQRPLSYLASLVYFAALGSAVEYSFRTKDFLNNEVEVSLAEVGCFKDHWSDRALRNMYYSHRGAINWDDWSNEAKAIILDCAKRAYAKGYTEAFAVQFYGECWSDGDAERRFSKYGSSSSCTDGVGKSWANFVYKFTVLNRQSSVSSCTVNGKNYNIGQKMDIPNDWSLNPNGAFCQKCACGSDGNVIDCSKEYYCDLGLGSLCARYKNVTGQCCPKCDCFNGDQVMPVGASWPVKNNNNECSMCSCGSDGIATCTAREKCSVCYGEEQPNPGQCCPKCVAKTTAAQEPQPITQATERPPPVMPDFP